MVLASASGFMCATISTSADQASVIRQVIRPSASNLGGNGRPSSTCSVVARGAKAEVSDTALLAAGFDAWLDAECGSGPDSGGNGGGVPGSCSGDGAAGSGSRPRMRSNMDPERVAMQPDCAAGR